MQQKTIIELLKKDEDNINKKAKIRDFLIDITDNKDNTGTITIWKFNNDTEKLSELLKFVEVLNIEGVAGFQINIKKGNDILEENLYIDSITQWIYNRINKENVKFMYQFFGGKYDGKTMTRTEIEKLSSGKTEDLTYIRQQGIICHRKELDNQPLVNGYLSPMFSHIDYGSIYLRYETQEVYDMLSN